MVGVRIDDPNAEQLLKSLTMLQDTLVSCDKGSTLALVRGVNVKRISPVVRTNDIDYFRQHLRPAEIIVRAIDRLVVCQIQVAILRRRWNGGTAYRSSFRIWIIRKLDQGDPSSSLKRPEF